MGTSRIKKSLFTIGFSVLVLSISGMAINNALAVPGTGTLFGTGPIFPNLNTINPVTGAFVVVGFTLDAAGTPHKLPGLAVDPTTGIMYGGEGGAGAGNLYTVNPTTAVVTLVGTTPVGALVSLDFDSSGQLWASVNTAPGSGQGGVLLAMVNKNTGAATIVGPFGPNHMGAIAFAPNGVLWGATNVGSIAGQAIWTISTSTGAATLIAFTNAPLGFASIQFDCAGTLFGGAAGGGFGLDDSFGTINLTTGAFTLIANLWGDTVGALAFAQVCPSPIGGTLVPIDTTALLLASVQSISMWMIPVVAAGIVIGVLVIKRRK